MNRVGATSSFVRFLRELYPILRRPLSFDEAGAILQRRLDGRADAWLRSLESNVFRNPISPYLPLLRRAGCELGDLHKSVRSDGVEPTLRALREEGVYVSFEEFKGREPIVRGDVVIHARAEDFDNPRARPGIVGFTGGTTGPATSVRLTVARIAEFAPARLLTQHAHELGGARMACWRNFAYPGLVHLLTDAAIGLPHERWFAPPRSCGLVHAMGMNVALGALRITARAARSRIPHPDWIERGDEIEIVRWATGAPTFLATGVSQAVRIGSVARDHGVQLDGLTIFGSGEPPTPAKLEAIRAAGIRLVPHYSTAEVGRIAIGCADPRDGTDMHVMTDSLAVTQHPRKLGQAGAVVEALLFTSLLPDSVKILLNVESDDFGEVDRRACGCPFEQAGFLTHVSNVYSFGKLTGEGVSLVGTQVQRILEDDLPRRFGGSALDYQVAEEEDGQGYTRITLIVSPRVVGCEDEEIVDAFLEALGSSRVAADVRMTWKMAGALRVRRSEPIETGAGKVLPLVPAHLYSSRRGGKT